MHTGGRREGHVAFRKAVKATCAGPSLWPPLPRLAPSLSPPLLAGAPQEVYGKLEEPDGLEGLVKLRRGGPRPEDQRLAAEKAGNWAEAATLYEQALQHGAGGGAAGAGASERAAVANQTGEGGWGDSRKEGCMGS